MTTFTTASAPLSWALFPGDIDKSWGGDQEYPEQQISSDIEMKIVLMAPDVVLGHVDEELNPQLHQDDCHNDNKRNKHLWAVLFGQSSATLRPVVG